MENARKLKKKTGIFEKQTSGSERERESERRRKRKGETESEKKIN